MPPVSRVRRLFRQMPSAQIGAGALIGAGVGVGITLASKLLSGLFNRRKTTKVIKAEQSSQKEDSVASTPKATKTAHRDVSAFGSPAFGSPASFDQVSICYVS